jgi:hypothetical protein
MVKSTRGAGLDVHTRDTAMAVPDEPGQLRSAGARVDGDVDRAHVHRGEPGEQVLGAVARCGDDAVPAAHAPLGEGGGGAPDLRPRVG